MTPERAMEWLVVLMFFLIFIALPIKCIFFGGC